MRRLAILLLALFLAGCVRPAPTVEPWYLPSGGTGGAPQRSAQLAATPETPALTVLPGQLAPSLTPAQPAPANPDPAIQPSPEPTQPPPEPLPAGPVIQPTADPPRPLPTLRSEVETYVVQPGDALGRIAQRYQLSLSQLAAANPTVNPEVLYVGTVLTIPIPDPAAAGPENKIIPDSELVYGPNAAGFDVAAFVHKYNAFLDNYHETVDDLDASGAEIVERVAREYSVNPRLLLAVLEYQSNWLTVSNPDMSTRDFPMGPKDYWRKGLYKQLAWAADTLNRGYYTWRVGGVSVWVLADGSVVPIGATINAGTAGMQNFFAVLYGSYNWRRAVSPEGFYTVYRRLFGDPFALSWEPLVPADLIQPALQLPFEEGASWSFTGGPHGGWGDGSAWAAIDFAPPGESFGCYVSGAWVVAMGDGPIVRSANGLVVQDLDGDGLEETGWTLLYGHIDSSERVAAGAYLHAGDRIGHASCEGGFSNGTHTHIARRYNGEWISADGSLPFVLDGWASSGDGYEYGGYITKNDQTIEAYNGRTEANQVWR